MTVLDDFLTLCLERLEAAVGVPVRYPPRAARARVACYGQWDVHALARSRDRRPAELASELARRIACGGLLDRVEARGAGLCFHLEPRLARERLLAEMQREGDGFGGRPASSERPIVLEMGSRPCHHAESFLTARELIVGSALARILTHRGHVVRTVCVLDDLDPAMGQLLEAYDVHGDDLAMAADPLGHLGRTLQLRWQTLFEGPEPTQAYQDAGWARYLEFRQHGDERLPRWRSALGQGHAAWHATLGATTDDLRWASSYEPSMRVLTDWVLESGLGRAGSEGRLEIEVESPAGALFLAVLHEGALPGKLTRMMAAARERVASHDGAWLIHVTGRIAEMDRLRWSLAVTDPSVEVSCVPVADLRTRGLRRPARRPLTASEWLELIAREAGCSEAEALWQLRFAMLETGPSSQVSGAYFMTRRPPLTLLRRLHALDAIALDAVGRAADDASAVWVLMRLGQAVEEAKSRLSLSVLVKVLGDLGAVSKPTLSGPMAAACAQGLRIAIRLLGGPVG